MQNTLQSDSLRCSMEKHTWKRQVSNIQHFTERVIYHCSLFRIKTRQYGWSKDWVFGLNLIYTSLHQEEREEFRICDFSCLLSSAGGYVGLFFGISIFDLIFSLEWILDKFYLVIIRRLMNRRPKKKNVKITSILIQRQLFKYIYLWPYNKVSNNTNRRT